MKNILSVTYPDQKREHAFCSPCTDIILNKKAAYTRLCIGDLLNGNASVSVPTKEGTFVVRELTNAAQCELCDRTGKQVYPYELEEISARPPIAIPETYAELKTCLMIIRHSGEYRVIRSQLEGERADDVYNAHNFLLGVTNEATEPLSPMHHNLIVHLIGLLGIPTST